MESEEAIPEKKPVEMPVGDYTTRIVGIRFKPTGRVYDFDAKEFKFGRGDKVVCDFEDKGQVLGFVSKPTVTIPADVLKLKLPSILRPANHNDLKSRERLEALEKDAIGYSRRKAQELNLKMHVISVEIPLHAKKALVYFTADDRIDFRELVKDLVRYFKMRVELRQLGARDETKYVGGIGPCGQETCCSKFLTSFHNVTIKMAKDQGLSLNPTKVSGNCGRLKCCLAYEQPVYAEARKTLPKLGNCVKCVGGGCGIVTKLDVLKQVITVKFDDGTFENVTADRIIEQDTMKPKPENVVITKDEDILAPEELETFTPVVYDEEENK